VHDDVLLLPIDICVHLISLSIEFIVIVEDVLDDADLCSIFAHQINTLRGSSLYRCLVLGCYLCSISFVHTSKLMLPFWRVDFIVTWCLLNFIFFYGLAIKIMSRCLVWHLWNLYLGIDLLLRLHSSCFKHFDIIVQNLCIFIQFFIKLVIILYLLEKCS